MNNQIKICKFKKAKYQCCCLPRVLSSDHEMNMELQKKKKDNPKRDLTVLVSPMHTVSG